MSNIFDIAQMAGVSKTTVSRVMNNQPGVKEETRTRVLEAIEKLMYTPNQAARALVTRRTNVIGVIYNELDVSVYIELANHLERYAKKFDYNVVFCSTNDNFESKLKYIRYFTGGAADGLILFCSDTKDKELVQKIKASSFPFVMIENHFSDININNIIIDNVNGARKAVQHLAELGHKRVAHITGNMEHRASVDRLQGYLAAVKDFGLLSIPEYIIETDAGKDSGYFAIDKLIHLEQPPTAIFTFNDVIGYEVVKRLTELGIRVPQDISIVGFDNITEVLNYIPSSVLLTSMKQPMDLVAQKAIELIIKNIENNSLEPQLVSFDTCLTHGNSCAQRFEYIGE